MFFKETEKDPKCCKCDAVNFNIKRLIKPCFVFLTKYSFWIKICYKSNQKLKKIIINNLDQPIFTRILTKIILLAFIPFIIIPNLLC